MAARFHTTMCPRTFSQAGGRGIPKTLHFLPHTPACMASHVRVFGIGGPNKRCTNRSELGGDDFPRPRTLRRTPYCCDSVTGAGQPRLLEGPGAGPASRGALLSRVHSPRLPKSLRSILYPCTWRPAESPVRPESTHQIGPKYMICKGFWRPKGIQRSSRFPNQSKDRSRSFFG